MDKGDGWVVLELVKNLGMGVKMGMSGRADGWKLKMVGWVHEAGNGHS